MTPKWIHEYEQEALILPRLSFLESKFIIYSPQVFRHIMSRDGIKGVDLSFDLIENREKLYRYGEGGGGGRSG